MVTVTGSVQQRRIRLKVGVRRFQGYTSVQAVPTAFELIYHECWALLDTGATRTCISENVVQALSLKRTGRVDVWNIKRSETHFTYLSYIAIWPDAETDGNPQAPFGIGNEIDGIGIGDNRFLDVLLGMDVLSQGSLKLARSGAFSLSF